MAIQKPLIKKFSLDGASRESWECMLKSKTVTREDCDLKSLPFDRTAISTFTPCCLPISVHFQLFRIRSFLALIVEQETIVKILDRVYDFHSGQYFEANKLPTVIFKSAFLRQAIYALKSRILVYSSYVFLVDSMHKNVVHFALRNFDCPNVEWSNFCFVEEWPTF